ncbi:MAG: hypothetical protein MZU91_11270 [Desulfosudis oleivorans]|nr:hypothetical protein [Desulfosudis oleivorans]
MVSLWYGDGVASQHRQLSGILRGRGIRVLDLTDLLDDAITEARQAGELERAMAEIFPDQFSRLKDELPRITARAVLGRVAELFFRYDENGASAPLVPTYGAFVYTRDFAVSTPRGIILTNGRPRWRKPEHRVGRFLFGMPGSSRRSRSPSTRKPKASAVTVATSLSRTNGPS